MQVEERRSILGSLAALLAAPFLLGHDTLISVLAPKVNVNDSIPPRITPPAHSVKRRG